MLSLHRALLSLRNRHDALRRGDYRPLELGKSLVAYRRGDSMAVVLNLSSETVELDLPDWLSGGEVILKASTGKGGGAVPSSIAGDEGLVITTTGASA